MMNLRRLIHLSIATLWAGLLPLGAHAQPAAPRPDALENNWSPASAAAVAVGLSYDLNFVCPEPNGCAGGDHDYLQFGVKAETEYLIATFDLAPGVDTVLDLFWGDPLSPTLLLHHDDVITGTAPLSVVRWQAPSDGIATVRVAPRYGNFAPPPQFVPPAYRFAVAAVGSPFAADLAARIATQSGVIAPSATPTPAATVAPAAASSPAAPAPPPTAPPILDEGFGGVAQVAVAELNLHTAPDAASPTVAALPQGSRLQLSGRVAGLWVEVRAAEVIGSAWADRRALVLLPDTSPPITPTLVPEALAAPDLPLLPPTTTSPPMIALPHQPLASVQLELQIVTSAGEPIVGMRVQLLNPLTDVLLEGITRADGRLSAAVAVAPGSALLLHVPSLGVYERIGADQALTITVAEEVQP